jgi:Putative prokaryotic signal transducing protein
MPSPIHPTDRWKQKLVKVYSAANEMEARMLQEVLAHAGIKSTINAEFAPGIYPSMMGDWARQDILVIESAAAEAERILSELPGFEAPEEGEDTAV